MVKGRFLFLCLFAFSLCAVDEIPQASEPEQERAGWSSAVEFVAPPIVLGTVAYWLWQKGSQSPDAEPKSHTLPSRGTAVQRVGKESGEDALSSSEEDFCRRG